jgi:hypothetical protein
VSRTAPHALVCTRLMQSLAGAQPCPPPPCTPLDSAGAVLARATVGLMEKAFVDVVGERRQHHFGDLFASSAIRSSFVVTWSGPNVPFIFPSFGSRCLAAPSLHWVPLATVPHFLRYYELLRLPDDLRASLRFLRSALPARSVSFAPTPDQCPPALAWARVTGRPHRPVFEAGIVRISQVPVEPLRRAPRSLTPARPRHLAWVSPRCSGAARTPYEGAGSHN